MSMSVVLYREHPSADWREVDVIGPHASGNVVLREVGPALPGVFLGDPAGIRVPVIGLHGVALLERRRLR